MKFETKYLIRWGIPGWVFLFWIFIPIAFEYPGVAKGLLQKASTTKLLSSILASAVIGVIIGYLLHQSYFSFEWIRDSKRSFLPKDFSPVVDKIKFRFKRDWGKDKIDDYYFIEFLWHKELTKLEEHQRNYVAERYRHLLSTTHSLGVLSYSLITVFTINLVFMIAWKNWFIAINLIILFVLGAMTLTNYRYYSRNTMNFMGYFLQELICTDTFKRKEN
jgi:hypothetical protein